MSNVRRRFRELLCLLMTIGIVVVGFLTLESIDAQAATSGDYEYNINSKGTVTITKYNGHSSKVIIPQKIRGKKVTNIGYMAFYQNKYLKEVVIPGSVKRIEDGYTFAYCKNLRSVQFSEGLQYIGYYDFYECSRLKHVDIPKTVTELSEGVFARTGLTSIYLPAKVRSINGNDMTAFNECKNLTRIVVDKANKRYDSRNDCNAIIDKRDKCLLVACKSTVIPKGIKRIGCYAYTNLTGITSVYVPHGVTSIGSWAFSDCRDLKKLYLPSSITTGYGIDEFSKKTFTVYCEKNSEIYKYVKEIKWPYRIGKFNRTDISKPAGHVSVSGLKATTYTGSEVYLKKLVVKSKGKVLVKNRDYSVIYVNNIKPGRATVKITGLNNYTGTIRKTFVIKKK